MAAIRCDDPVVFMEHKGLWGMTGEVDESDTEPLPLGVARTVCKGSDLTIVTWSAMVGVAEIAAASLRAMGISAEVIDLVLLAWAEHLIVTPRLGGAENEGWQNVIRLADEWSPIDFPLRGRDVLELGVGEGPEVSALLGEVEDWWLMGGCHAGRDDCLVELRRRHV